MVRVLVSCKRVGACPALHCVETTCIWVSGRLLLVCVHILHHLVKATQDIVGVDWLLSWLLRLLLLLLLHRHLLLIHHHLLLHSLLHRHLHLVCHHVGLLAHKHAHHGVSYGLLRHHTRHCLLLRCELRLSWLRASHQIEEIHIGCLLGCSWLSMRIALLVSAFNLSCVDVTGSQQRLS